MIKILSAADHPSYILNDLHQCLADLKCVKELAGTPVLKELDSPVTMLRANELMSMFLLKEAQEMDENEPFHAQYIIGFHDQGETVLGCDVQLSTPGVESRTFYGVSALRIGNDEYIVDTEGASRLMNITALP